MPGVIFKPSPNMERFPVSSTKDNRSAIILCKQGHAINDSGEAKSKSTNNKESEKLSFQRNRQSLFEQKSSENDSESSSLVCDSTIQHEASDMVNNIYYDIEDETSTSDTNIIGDNTISDNFLVSASDEIVLLKDFAFNDQDNFFAMPDNLRIPLNISNIQGNSPNFPENLSLIEELTEHSSSATNKSEEVISRNILNNLEKEIKHSNLITSK